MKFLTAFSQADLAQTDHIFVIAPLAFIQAHAKDKAGKNPIGDIPGWSLLQPSLADTKAVKTTKTLSTYTGSGKQRLSVILLTDTVSRGCSPAKKEWMHTGLAELGSAESPLVIAVLPDADTIGAAVGAVGRRMRAFTTKTGGKDKTKDKDKSKIKGSFLATDLNGVALKPSPMDEAVLEPIRWCCEMVDRPPTDLNPKAYSKKIKKWFEDDDDVTFDEIAGKDLLERGMNGIHAVGRTAIEAPRMVILDYNPNRSGKKDKSKDKGPVFGLVGKGLTYDTGGLSLKTGGNMEGMKVDMAGSAAIVAAFKTLVNIRFRHRVVAIVGLAENAIGPDAYKPDDILKMYSGKTVEINNTDAEGRLVLADCLAYLCETYKPKYLFDAATLTGAQLIATGVMHAAVIANDDSAEQALVKAATTTGDQVAPLPFAPEFFNKEFESQVADMTNSVKSRMNGGTCCAGVFLHNHIEDTGVKWGHIDLAGPSADGKGLGTGFGTHLIAKAVTLLADQD